MDFDVIFMYVFRFFLLMLYLVWFNFIWLLFLQN